MTSDFERLMLEQFRKPDDKAERLTDIVKYTHSQQLSDRLTLRSIHTSLDGNNELLTGLSARVARIERRLELADQISSVSRCRPVTTSRTSSHRDDRIAVEENEQAVWN